jgi:ABC-2 type transport system ATP-binding protein
MNGKIVFTGTKDELLEKYIRVAGGLKDITTEQKNLLIGYREHGTGFEGMAETSCKNKFSSKILIEKITLDEIIVFMNKNEKN